MDTVLLSFDTSTKHTGYAKYVNGELKDYGLLDFADIPSAERTEKMIHAIYEMIDREHPSIVAIELTVVERNAQTQRTLTTVIGAVYGKCLENDIFYYAFRPSEWRSLISSEQKPRKRKELKEWGWNWVKENMNIECKSDDVSDAIMIGKAYINLFTEE